MDIDCLSNPRWVRGGLKISGKFDNSLPVYGRYGGDGYGEREKENKWIFLFASFWYRH
jgi:hypothetical protein